MNRLNGISWLKQRLSALIEREIKKAADDIKECDQNIYDNEAYYGLGGGHATQYEKAKQRRKEYIEQLEALKKSHGEAVILDEITLYKYYCPDCKEAILMNHRVKNMIDCPLCQRTLFLSNDYENMKIVRGSRFCKVGSSYIKLTSEGILLDSIKAGDTNDEN